MRPREASCAEAETRQRLGEERGIRSDRRSVVRPLKVPRVERERPERRHVTSHCPRTRWRGRLLTRSARPAGRAAEADATTITRLPEAISEAMTCRPDAPPAVASVASNVPTMTALMRAILLNGDT